MKRSLSHGAKKEYVKPAITRNEPLVDITFVSGTVTGTGGNPGGLITVPKAAPGGGSLAVGVGELGGTSLGGDELGGGAGSLTGGGSLLPGTGGAPGTVL